MSEYTFIYKHDDGTSVAYTGNKEAIYELIKDFRDFLRGVGYSDELIENVLRREYD